MCIVHSTEYSVFSRSILYMFSVTRPILVIRADFRLKATRNLLLGICGNYLVLGKNFWEFIKIQASVILLLRIVKAH